MIIVRKGEGGGGSFYLHVLILVMMLLSRGSGGGSIWTTEHLRGDLIIVVKESHGKMRNG